MRIAAVLLKRCPLPGLGIAHHCPFPIGASAGLPETEIAGRHHTNAIPRQIDLDL
jgi:hypothetical protein